MQSFAFAALASVAAAISADELEFSMYAARFNKIYADVEEFSARLERFMHYDRLIREHNASESNFKLGHNQFSDWTDAEYKAIQGFVSSEKDTNYESDVKIPDSEESELPDYVNWVEAGAVTPVKDQGYCGSCYAFSAIGALEGAHFIASGELLSFSEQQIIDCDTKDSQQGLYDYNEGCHGGDMRKVFKYFKEGNFPMLESAYPYA